MKFDPQTIQEMAKDFINSLPPGLKSLQGEIDNHFRQFLQSTFHKWDLVTREEFDVQLQVLAKTRAKIEQLEAQIKDLETRSNQPSK